MIWSTNESFARGDFKRGAGFGAGAWSAGKHVGQRSLCMP
jgi:hypothetical protein